MTYTCDGCGAHTEGRRVVFTTEATDDRGVDVDVSKRWVTCPRCGDEVFQRIGMSSPWTDADGRTLTIPGGEDELLGATSPGFAGSFRR